MADDDDDGFGDFTFAPSNSTFRSDPPMNGRSSFTAGNDGDDDDWGDFVAPAGLAHAISLPRFPNQVDPFRLHSDRNVNGEESEPKQPGSAPGRASGVAQWKKPSGALPLSLFGELEDEGKPEGGDPSFGDGGSGLFSGKSVDSVKKVSVPSVNDLIADLYKENGSAANLNRSHSDDKINKDEKKSDLNMNARSVSAVHLNSISSVPDFGWNWGNSNGNGKSASKLDAQGLNLDWDPLKTNQSGLNSNNDVAKEVIPVANGDSLVSVGVNETFDNGGGGGGGGDGDGDGDDDDDGWEFKDAVSDKTSVAEENSKTNQIKAENGPVVNSNGINTTWNSMHMDFDGWNWEKPNGNGKIELKMISQGLNFGWDPLNLNLNGLNSNNDAVKEVTLMANGDKLASVGGSETFDNGDDDNGDDDDGDDDDGWEFKDAQTNNTSVAEENSKTNQINTEKGPVVNSTAINTTWNSMPVDFNGWDSNFGTVGTNFFNMGLVNQARDDAGAEDDDDDDGWEFKVADSKTQVGDAKIRNEDVPASSLSLDKTKSSSSNGGTLGVKPVNLNLFDKNEDFWGNDGWEIKTAGSVLGPANESTKDDSKISKDSKVSIDTFGFGDGEHGPGDLFGASQGTSQEFVESNSSFALGLDKSEHNYEVDKNLGSSENSWLSKDAFPETITLDEGNKDKVDNHKRALPLYFFGDEEKEADDLAFHQESSILMTSSDLKSSNKNPKVDINDLISSLYGQAVQNTSANHEQILGGNALDSSNGNGGNLASDSIDFDDDSWDFQDASLGAGGNVGDQVQKNSTKTEQIDYLEFFSKLREELHYTLQYHLQNLKNLRASVSLTDNGAEVYDVDKEIQDLESELQDYILSTEVSSENRTPREISLNLFVEALQEPKFQAFESEYKLTKKLPLAESNWRSAISVLKCVVPIVNILTSASWEEQSSYISAWSKMASVCAQELRHGASIWKQAMQQNLQNQILSKPQGKKYVLALGEVYRVAKIIESSAKLYKPWISVSSSDSMFIFSLISECSSLWSSSGLEEALQSISSSADLEYDGSVKTLLESIKYITDLDVQALFDHVFSGRKPTCQLSALTAESVPGMKTIEWNGKQAFVTVANLWANLVSTEPPELPCIQVG